MNTVAMILMPVLLINLVYVTQSLWREQRKRIRRLRGDKMTHDEMIERISEWKDICKSSSWDGVDAIGIEEAVVHKALHLIESGIVDDFIGGICPTHSGTIKFFKYNDDSIFIEIQTQLYKVESIERVEPVYCYTLDDVRDALR